MTSNVNTKAFRKRIADPENTPADFDRLEKALVRLYENGIFTAQQFMDLDHALICERVAVEMGDDY